MRLKQITEQQKKSYILLAVLLLNVVVISFSINDIIETERENQENIKSFNEGPDPSGLIESYPLTFDISEQSELLGLKVPPYRFWRDPDKTWQSRPTGVPGMGIHVREYQYINNPYRLNLEHVASLGTPAGGYSMTPVRGATIDDYWNRETNVIANAQYANSWRGIYAPRDFERKIIATAGSNWDVHEIGIAWSSFFADTSGGMEFQYYIDDDIVPLHFDPFITEDDWTHEYSFTKLFGISESESEVSGIPFVTSGNLRSYRFNIYGSNDYYDWNLLQKDLTSTQYHTNFKHDSFSDDPSSWAENNPLGSKSVNGQYHPGSGMVTIPDDDSWQHDSWNDLEWYEVQSGYRYYKIKITHIGLSGNWRMIGPDGEYKYDDNGHSYVYPEIGEIKFRYSHGEDFTKRSLSMSSPRDESILKLKPTDHIPIEFNSYSAFNDFESFEFYFNGLEERKIEISATDLAADRRSSRELIPFDDLMFSEHWTHHSGNQSFLQNPISSDGRASIEFEVFNQRFRNIREIELETDRISRTNVSVPFVRRFEDDSEIEKILYGDMPEEGDVRENVQNAYVEYDPNEDSSFLKFSSNQRGKYEFTSFGEDDIGINILSNNPGAFVSTWEYGTYFELKYNVFAENDVNKRYTSTDDLLYAIFHVNRYESNELNESYEYIDDLYLILPISGGYRDYFGEYGIPGTDYSYQRINAVKEFRSHIKNTILDEHSYLQNKDNVFFQFFQYETKHLMGSTHWDTYRVNNLENVIASFMYDQYDKPMVGFEFINSSIHVQHNDPSRTYGIKDIGIVAYPKEVTQYNEFRLEIKNEHGYYYDIGFSQIPGYQAWAWFFQDSRHYYDDRTIGRIFAASYYADDQLEQKSLVEFLHQNNLQHLSNRNITIHLDSNPTAMLPQNENSTLRISWSFSWHEATGYRYRSTFFFGQRRALDLREQHSLMLMYGKPSPYQFQFGGFNLKQISMIGQPHSRLFTHFDGWSSREEWDWGDRFYDVSVPLSIGTKQPYLATLLRTLSSHIPNIWENARHSEDYNIRRHHTTSGVYYDAKSSAPTKDSFIEMDLYFPNSGYYDIFLTRSNPLQFYDSNLYNIYINDQLYRKTHQSTTIPADYISVLMNLIAGEMDFDLDIDFEYGWLWDLDFDDFDFEKYLSEYEGYGQFPSGMFGDEIIGLDMDYWDTLITYFRTLSTGITFRDLLKIPVHSNQIRAASDYFEAGVHTLRIEFDSHDSRTQFFPTEQKQIDVGSYIGLDSISLFHRSHAPFSIPVHYLEQFFDPDPTSNIHNLTFTGYYSNGESISITNTFQLISEPFLDFNGGNHIRHFQRFPQLFEDNYLKQQEYIDPFASNVSFLATCYDNDIDIETFQWKLNDGNWNQFDNIEGEIYAYIGEQTIQMNQINEGKNIITIRVSDIKGHEAKSYLIFWSDTIPPDINVEFNEGFELIDDMYYVQREGKISLNVSDENNLKRIEYLIKPEITEIMQRPFFSEVWFPIYDYQLNATVSDFSDKITFNSYDFGEGNNTLYIRAIDMAGNNDTVSVNIKRSSAISTINEIYSDWRVINDDVFLAVNTSNVKIKETIGYTQIDRSHLPLSRNDLYWAELGRFDLGAFEHTVQPFVAQDSVLQSVGIYVTYRAGSVARDLPIILEILDTDQKTILSKGYGIPRSHHDIGLVNFEIPDVTLMAGETYYFRVTPYARNNRYQIGFLPFYDSVESENMASGLFYGVGNILAYGNINFDQFFQEANGGKISYLMRYRTIEPQENVGNIRYRVNKSPFSSEYTGGIMAVNIPQEKFSHGENLIEIEIDNLSGEIFTKTRKVLWVDPEIHTVPQFEIISPQKGTVNRGNITIKIDANYPEYNETYDIQYFATNEKLEQWIWIGNQSLPEDTETSIVEFVWNSTEKWGDESWFSDSYMANIKIRIDDGYTAGYEKEVGLFIINNEGPDVQIISPRKTHFNRDVNVQLNAKTLDTSIYRLSYTFTPGRRKTDVTPYQFRHVEDGSIYNYDFFVDLRHLEEGLHNLYIDVYDIVDGSQIRETTITIPIIVDRSIEILFDTHSPLFPHPNDDTYIYYHPEYDWKNVDVFLSYYEEYGERGFRKVQTLKGADQINGSLNLGLLQVGSYRVFFIVTDEAGNIAQNTYSFTVTEGGIMYSIGEYGNNILMIFASLFALGLVYYNYKNEESIKIDMGGKHLESF